MKVKTFAAVLAFSLAIGVHVNNVSAFPVTWEFEGVVDTTATDINNLFGGAVTFGMPISGQFTFESTTPDVFPEDEVTGNYRNAIVSITGFLGDIPFAREFGTSTSIGIDNDFINAPNSIKDAFRGGGDINIVGQILGFGIFLTDADATMFSNDSLPLYPPDLAIIEFATFSITSQPLGVNFSGHLTSLVPEPATITLLAVGAFACLKRRRRSPIRKRRVNQTSSFFILMMVMIIGVNSRLQAQTTDCGCMDVVFLIDTTSSMQNPLLSIREDISSIVDEAKLKSGNDLRLGLITFDSSVQVDASLTTDVQSVVVMIEALSVTGGGPRPESSDEALREMLSDSSCTTLGDFNVPFRSQCIKHAILITDALPAESFNVGRSPTYTRLRKAWFGSLFRHFDISIFQLFDFSKFVVSYISFGSSLGMLVNEMRIGALSRASCMPPR